MTPSPSPPHPSPPSPPPSLLIILHGKASGDPGIRSAVDTIRSASAGALRIDVRPTYSAGDARAIVAAELAAAAANARPPIGTIVAAGGDGTLCEVIGALLEYEDNQKHKADAPRTLPSVASLLAGTANDLASAAGISADPVQALQLAADASRARPVDVALCNGHAFVNVATVGPISSVSSAGMSETLKRLLGPLSVPVAGAAQLLTRARRHALRPQNVTLVFPTARGVDEPPLPGEKGGGRGSQGSAKAAAAATAAAAVAAAANVAAAAAAAASPPPASAASAAAAEPATSPAAESAPSPSPPGSITGAAAAADVLVLPPVAGAAGAAIAQEGRVMAVRGASAALAVGQARQMGRLVNVCPDALLDDGLLDVTALFAPSLASAAAGLAAEAVAAVVGGGGDGGAEGAAAAAAAAPPRPPPPLPAVAGLCTLRVPWLHVLLEEEDRAPPGISAPSDPATAAGVVPATASPAAAATTVEAFPPPLLLANLDGEPLVQERALRFAVRPAAVRYHLPDDRLLVAGVAEGDQAKAAAAHEVAVGLPAVAEAAAAPPASSSSSPRQQRRQRRREQHAAAAARLRRRLAAPLRVLHGGAAPSRADLLRSLLRAKQPPGRMARALPVIMARLRRAALALALVALGALIALALVMRRQGGVGVGVVAGGRARC
jgi:diacylglycerol kinase family enzyme